MPRSRLLLYVGLALACVVELILFIALLRAPEPPVARPLALEDTLDPGEVLVVQEPLSAEAPVSPPEQPELALRLVTARVTVDAAGNITTNIEPGAWVPSCPGFAAQNVLQARAQTSLAEDAGALVVQRTACVSVRPGYEAEVRSLPDTSRLLATDEAFEGSIEARAWPFESSPGQIREIRAAGLFWCPEELEESDTCFAAASLEMGEAGAPLLVPVRVPGRGSSAVSLSPR